MANIHTMSDPLHRFLSRVQGRSEGSCWVWDNVSPSQRYGTFYLWGKRRMAHVASYLLFRGPYEEGLVIDHQCENTYCVNPNHLEPVTQAENVRRHHDGKTHCNKGHDLSKTKRYKPGGKWECRTCRGYVITKSKGKSL